MPRRFLLLLVVVTACTPAGRSTAPPVSITMAPIPPTTAPGPASTVVPAVSSTAPPPPNLISYRVERRTSDAETADFVEVVTTTLDDARGWQRAGFRFVRSNDAPYLVVLAEGDEVDRLCLPYDTYGAYSCQNGPVVALNAERWRRATPKWTADVGTYRVMLVNHEVGHLLGQKHPQPQCPAPGQLAPVMNQQSTELNGCRPNPWPLEHEIASAARHDRKLAPGPGE